MPTVLKEYWPVLRTWAAFRGISSHSLADVLPNYALSHNTVVVVVNMVPCLWTIRHMVVLQALCPHILPSAFHFGCIWRNAVSLLAMADPALHHITVAVSLIDPYSFSHVVVLQAFPSLQTEFWNSDFDS